MRVLKALVLICLMLLCIQGAQHDISDCNAFYSLILNTLNDGDIINLTQNISCSGSTYAGSKDFVDIVFEGNGHEISDISISAPYASVIADTANTIIRNLVIRNLQINTDQAQKYAGFVSENSQGSLTFRKVAMYDSNITTTWEYAGAFFGRSRSAIYIYDCDLYSTFVTATYHAGGFGGEVSEAYAENCFNHGYGGNQDIVIANTYAGGLFAGTDEVKIFKSGVLSGQIKANYVGGIVSYFSYSAQLDQVFVEKDVSIISTNGYAAGMFAYTSDYASAVTNSYSKAFVQGSNVGGMFASAYYIHFQNTISSARVQVNAGGEGGVYGYYNYYFSWNLDTDNYFDNTISGNPPVGGAYGVGFGSVPGISSAEILEKISCPPFSPIWVCTTEGGQPTYTLAIRPGLVVDKSKCPVVKCPDLGNKGERGKNGAQGVPGYIYHINVAEDLRPVGNKKRSSAAVLGRIPAHSDQITAHSEQITTHSDQITVKSCLQEIEELKKEGQATKKQLEQELESLKKKVSELLNKVPSQ